MVGERIQEMSMNYSFLPDNLKCPELKLAGSKIFLRVPRRSLDIALGIYDRKLNTKNNLGKHKEIVLNITGLS